MPGNSAATAAKGLSLIESAKRAAAYAAVDAHVRAEHKLIGIGSGSTVPYVVERIVAQGAEANRGRFFVPTGFQSKNLILEGGLTLGDIDVLPQLDVTIDGADEVDTALNLIKGGGACQLREKVLAEAANDFVVVADFRKRSPVLGTAWKQGVPIEVVPFAATHVMNRLKALGSTNPVLRMGKAKAGPVISDNNNLCIDAPFPTALMRDPAHLLFAIKKITGVVEVGIFPSMCKAAYFGNDDGTIAILKDDGSVQDKVRSTSP